MLLCDELMFCASVLKDGDAGPYSQQVASSRLVRIADRVRHMEELLDEVADSAREDEALAAAQNEAALAAMPLHRKPRFRLVVSS
jgi:hypothetical protein